MFGNQNFNQLVSISPNNSLRMIFYPFSVPLKINTLSFLIFLNFLLLIFPTSLMIIIVLTKVLIFHLLFVPMQNNPPPSLDTTSNVSIQTRPSTSNAVINTKSIVDPNVDPPTSQTNIITTQPSTSPTPIQYTAPSNNPLQSPLILHNPVFQIPTLPPIHLSFNTTITTQPQSRTTQTHIPPNPLVINPYSPSSLPMPHNLFTSQSASKPPPTPNNPNASLVFILVFKIIPLSLFNHRIFLLTLSHHQLLPSTLTLILLSLLQFFR